MSSPTNTSAITALILDLQMIIRNEGQAVQNLMEILTELCLDTLEKLNSNEKFSSPFIHIHLDPNSESSVWDDGPANLIKQLEEWKSHKNEVTPSLMSEITDFCKTVRKEFRENVSEYLAEHLVDGVDTEDQVKKTIEMFPETLSMSDSEGFLPIISMARVYWDEEEDHEIVWCPITNKNRLDRVYFMAVLAREGQRENVGGRDTRGGLLLDVWPGCNCIQNLALKNRDIDEKEHYEEFDMKLMNSLKRLHEFNLLKKSDVTDHRLLLLSANKRNIHRFDFLVNLNPDALRDTMCLGAKRAPLIVYILYYETGDSSGKEAFEMILRAGMKHFPDDMGFLFRKYMGKTAFEHLIVKFGATPAGCNETMSIITRCIPPSENYPILHQVANLMPKRLNVIGPYYPDALYLKDKHQRSMFQSQLEFGEKRFYTHFEFFANATDKQIEEKDPVTDLFPFMTAASDDVSDLSAVYWLLRKNPMLIYGRRTNKKTVKRQRVLY